ncbi:MAG: hypothetical protein LBU95_05295, partial [Rikenellaceae bacterium]|nr:hypothetical protein [Rikenellaceae bacterium]
PAIWFDAARGRWSGQYPRTSNYTYLHHNKLYSPRDSSLLQLFGYGMHRYRSNVYRLTPDGEVLNYDLSGVVPPRYLSAEGVTDSLLYIYGGVGNLSGKQEFGTEIFNDLYALDLQSYQPTLLWSRPTTSDSEVAAGTLVPTPDGKALQGLFFCPSRYASYLAFKELNIKSGESRMLADTIPYSFHDTGSAAGLAADSAGGKLYAYTIHKTQQGDMRLDIYSIDMPVLAVGETILEPYAPRWRAWPAYAGAVCLLAIAALLLALRRRRRAPEQVEIDEEAIRAANEQARTSRSRPGIYLLGDFGVIDASGKDIAPEFTPTMRQILALVVFNTENNGRGVSNAQLRDALWYDKNEESARNNRNVNIRKIRLLLETVGGLQITTDANYWKIIYSGEGYCDWVYAMRYMDKIADSPRIALRRLPELLQLVSMGRLLSGEAFDWLDEYKSRYSDKVIGLLGVLRDGDLFAHAPQALVLICEGILSFDSLDEDSMKVKCRALVALGRIGAAKKSFDSFVREYAQVMGERYPHSFEKLFQT